MAVKAKTRKNLNLKRFKTKPSLGEEGTARNYESYISQREARPSVGSEVNVTRRPCRDMIKRGEHACRAGMVPHSRDKGCKWKRLAKERKGTD